LKEGKLDNQPLFGRGKTVFSYYFLRKKKLRGNGSVLGNRKGYYLQSEALAGERHEVGSLEKETPL